MSLEPLVARLADMRESVRRLAVMDLAAKADGPDREAALAALCAHVEHETDEKAALAAIRALGNARYEPSRPVLRRLYDLRETPVRIAHAAILGHDAIELGSRVPVQSARGNEHGP